MDLFLFEVFFIIHPILPAQVIIELFFRQREKGLCSDGEHLNLQLETMPFLIELFASITFEYF